MRYDDLKRHILHELFYCHIFISIIIYVYTIYIKEEAQINEMALRFGIGFVPVVLTHVPWSAMRWGVRAKILREEGDYDYNILSALIDIAFGISVIISMGFIFELFEVSIFFFCTIIAIIFFMIASIKTIFFSPNS